MSPGWMPRRRNPSASSVREYIEVALAARDRL
jgi:hypothetical protein